MMTLLEWIQLHRPDVTWIKGPNTDGLYTWDGALSNESEIQYLIQNYDPNLQLTEEQKKQKQREKDFLRYTRRAEVRDRLIVEMAAGNMERVRSGVWTVQELIDLTRDPELKQVLDDVQTLSFEIAHSKIDMLTNPILTPEIKNGWKKLLEEHFYL